MKQAKVLHSGLLLFSKSLHRECDAAGFACARPAPGTGIKWGDDTGENDVRKQLSLSLSLSLFIQSLKASYSSAVGLRAPRRVACSLSTLSSLIQHLVLSPPIQLQSCCLQER
jgi:hypothetical protein